MAFLATPSWPVFRVFGPDSATWLNGIVTADVTGVAPGRGVWGLLLTKTGKIQAELQIVGRPDELFVGVSGGDAAAAFDTLSHYLVMEDAELERSTDHRFVVAYGEGAFDALEAPSRMPWMGAEGAVVVVAEPRVVAIARGARARGVEVNPPDLAARLVELGMPRFGVDYGESDNPHEASLERRTVSWSKGCYLGQEVVCMQDMRGKVKRRLVWLTGNTGALAESAVLVDGGEVGVVKSAGPTRLIASVKAPHYEPGTRVVVAGRDFLVEPLGG